MKESGTILSGERLSHEGINSIKNLIKEIF